MTIVGVVSLVMLFGTVGLWASTAPLAGAVIASGKIVVESNVRRIQHPSGVVVAKIHVKNGDYISAGDVLVRLAYIIKPSQDQLVRSFRYD